MSCNCFNKHEVKPCNCHCNHNVGVDTGCQTCEPNANVCLEKCAGYGYFNRCNCACPPPQKPIQNNCGCNCGSHSGSHCGCGSVAPLNPCAEPAKKACNCVIDHIENYVLNQVEEAANKFIDNCTRHALGLPEPRNYDCGCDYGYNDDYQCGCNTGCNCGCQCDYQCDCNCGCNSGCNKPSVDCKHIVKQTAKCAADEMVCSLEKAIKHVACDAKKRCGQLALPCGNTHTNCGCNNNCSCNNNCIQPRKDCGCNCPTTGKNTNQTTWGRCY